MRAAFVFGLFMITAASLRGEGRLLLDADFDGADLTGWKVSGDLCVAPSFCGGEAPGRYWVALSTNNSEDPLTMCGSNSVGGVSTVLRSPAMALPWTASQIRIEFKVKFFTSENTATDLGTDSFVVRLVTSAGPVVFAAFDDSGASPDSKNLTIKGDATFRESRCNPTWKYETGLLHVSYYRAFREPFRSRMASGPIAVEFALSNHFDANFDSAAVIDDVQLTVYR